MLMLRCSLGSLAAVLTVGVFSLAPLPANAISSTFDVDLEGWTAIGIGEPTITFIPPAVTNIPISDNAADMMHSASDGNLGGYARFTDAVNDPSALASAPDAFLGDLTSFIGGTFSFDHKLFTPGASATGFAPYILIIGSGAPENLDALIWFADAPSGPTGWEHFDVTLDVTNDPTGLTFLEDVALSDIDPDFPNVVPSAFGVGGDMTFEEIMANVDFIWLAFELVDNANVQMDEHGGIDNIMLTAIPEPTTGTLLALGLAGLALRGRRSRSPAQL